MILMRLNDVKSCPEHAQAIIVLEDVSGQRKLAIAVDPGESRRLGQEMRQPGGRQPIYELLDAVLQACQATPTRVTLDYVPGAGLAGALHIFGPAGEVPVPCYVADAIALARRSTIPIYVSANAFSDTDAPPLVSPPSDARGEIAQWLEGLTPSDFSDVASDRPAAE